MTREKITDKILHLIDEVSTATLGGVVSYPIESVLDESARYILAVAPSRLVTVRTDFKTTEHIANEDGTGSVKLPPKFIRLTSFMMVSWSNDKPTVIDTADLRLTKQFNKYTRGGSEKPIVVIDGDKLYYYSVGEGVEHIIEKAEAITEIPNLENFPEALIDPLCWIAAANTLTIMSEGAAAAEAKAHAIEILTTL